MRTALVIGGRPDYAGPAVRILPRTGARIIDFSINNNDQQQQLSRYKSLSDSTITNQPQFRAATSKVNSCNL